MGKFQRETDTDMFDDARERIVRVSILEEIYQDIRMLCQENKWEEEEGLRTVLAYGLGYLQARQELTRLSASEPDLAAELQSKVEELSRYQSMYAVMKFKAFKLLQVAQTLEMNVAGLRGELGLCRATLPLLREQIEQLKAENTRLQGQMAMHSHQVESTMNAAAPQPQRSSALASLSLIIMRLRGRRRE